MYATYTVSTSSPPTLQWILSVTDGGESEEVRGVGVEDAAVRAEGEELTAEGLWTTVLSSEEASFLY